MTDETKLSIAAARAMQAEQLLNNDLFNAAIAQIRANLIEAWEATPPRDTEGRERCWHAVQQIGNIKGYFHAVLNDGKLAAHQLQALAETAERNRR